MKRQGQQISNVTLTWETTDRLNKTDAGSLCSIKVFLSNSGKTIASTTSSSGIEPGLRRSLRDSTSNPPLVFLASETRRAITCFRLRTSNSDCQLTTLRRFRSSLNPSDRISNRVDIFPWTKNKAASSPDASLLWEELRLKLPRLLKWSMSSLVCSRDRRRFEVDFLVWFDLDASQYVLTKPFPFASTFDSRGRIHPPFPVATNRSAVDWESWIRFFSPKLSILEAMFTEKMLRAHELELKCHNTRTIRNFIRVAMPTYQYLQRAENGIYRPEGHQPVTAVAHQDEFKPK